jgi:catalase
MVSHLLNIDTDLANQVAQGLRLREMPAPATAARPTRRDLRPSPALSILANGPKTFAGRTIGVMVSDGVDAGLLDGIIQAAKAEKATVKLIAPAVGGVKASDGTWRDAHERIEGGPSVLFDAVALLPSEAGAKELASIPAAREFVADAHAHRKFIAYCETARSLISTVIGSDRFDAGYVPVSQPTDAEEFLRRCRALRYWDRAGAER